MQDRKTVIYGLVSDGADPETFVMRAVTVSQDGFIGENLFLQGSAIFSINPFDPQFDVDDGVLDMVPVVSFNYICGPDVGGTSIFGRMKYCAGSNLALIDPTASTMVAELASDGISHDTPADDTAAQCNVAAGAGEYVRVTGFGFSITAVAAIVVPVVVTLTGDVGGGANILFERRYVVPAGETKDVWIDGPFGIFQDVRLDVGAPGATNFVTAEIASVQTGAAPS